MRIIESAFNNNPNIVGYEIPLHSEEWHQFRQTGIPNVYPGGFGASEISTICGKNSRKYGMILPVLLEHKAGLSIPERRINEHMLSGILAEPIILERWKYYDGTELGYLKNYQDNKVVRNHRLVNMYLVNKKYPWLFASLDASILKDQGNLIGGRLKEESPLECKQLSYFAAQTWENKIPPQYIYQINQQMLVTETEYAELAVLQDGYSFTVYPFEMNVEICEEILEKSRAQWENVLVMRKIKSEIDYYIDINKMDKVEALKAELDSMIPEPDSSEGWKEFLNERYIVEKESFPGKMKHFREVLKRQKLKKAINILQDECDTIDNKFRAEFVKNNAEFMDFGNSGKVKYSKVGKNKDPQFNYAGIKSKADEAPVRAVIEPLLD